MPEDHELSHIPSTEITDDKRPPRTFARIKIPATLMLTIEVTGADSKNAILGLVQQELRNLTDAQDGINVTRDPDPRKGRLHFAKESEPDIDENTIFTLRGVSIVDTFDDYKLEN